MGQRIDNWQIAYQKAIEKPRKFNRGTTDCVMFVLDCVCSYTDSNLIKKYYNKYSNLSQGLKILKELKAEGKTLNEMIISNTDNHFERIHINLAQRGDIVGLNSDMCSKANKMKDSGFTLGIMCEGFGRFVVNKGYEDIPRDKLEIAWRV